MDADASGREMGTTGFTDNITTNYFPNEKRYIPAHTYLTGSSLVKARTTTGINTYKPQTDTHVLDINGPTCINHEEIHVPAMFDFEIDSASFVFDDGVPYGFIIGTPIEKVETENIKTFTIPIYETDNGGKNWKHKTDISNQTIESLVKPDSNIFARTRAFYIYSIYDDLYRRFSNEILNINPQNDNIQTIVAIEKELIYFSTDNKIYKYSNNSITILIGHAATTSTIYKEQDESTTAFFIREDFLFISNQEQEPNTYKQKTSPNKITYNSIKVKDGRLIAVGIPDTSYNIIYANYTSYGGFPNNMTLNYASTSTSNNEVLNDAYIIDSSNCIVVGKGGIIYISKDAMQTWTKITKNMIDGMGNADVLLDPQTNIIKVLVHDIQAKTFCFLCNRLDDVFETDICDNIVNRGRSYTCYAYFPNLFHYDTTPIILDVDGHVNIEGNVEIDRNVTIGKNIQASQNASFGGHLDICGNTVIDGHTHIHEYINIDGSANIGNNTRIGGNVDISGNTIIDGTTIIQQDVSMQSNLYVHNNITLAGDTISSNNTKLSLFENNVKDISFGCDASNIYMGIDNPDGTVRMQGNYFYVGYKGLPTIQYKTSEYISTAGTDANPTVGHFVIGGDKDIRINNTLFAKTVVTDEGSIATNASLSATGGTTSNQFYVQKDISGINSEEVLQNTRVDSGFYITGNRNLSKGPISTDLSDITLSRNDGFFKISHYGVRTTNYLQELQSSNTPTYNSELYPYPEDSYSIRATGNTNQLRLNLGIQGLQFNHQDISIQQYDGSACMILLRKKNGTHSEGFDNFEMAASRVLWVDEENHHSLKMQNEHDKPYIAFYHEGFTNDGSYNPTSKIGDVAIYSDRSPLNIFRKNNTSNENNYKNGLRIDSSSCVLSANEAYVHVHPIGMTVSGDTQLYGTLDVSGVTYIDSSTTINDKLYVEDDVSFNSKLYVHNNVTLNRHVDISGVTRIDDKLYVEDDVSFNNKLYVHNDASFNARVDISGATRIDDKLYVEDDVSFNNKLYVHNDASFNARVDISGATRIDDKLYVEDDVSFNNKLYVHNDVSFNEKLFVKSSSRFKDYVMFEDTIQVSKNSTFEDKVLINTENNYNESNGGLHNYGNFSKATLLLEHTNADHGASSIVFQNNVINNTEQHYGTLSYLDNFLDSYNPHSLNYSNIVRANDISHNGLFLSATNDNDASNDYMSHIVIRPTGHLILDTGISAETHENRSGNNPPGHILMMPNGGKVGIGTLDPSYNLDVRYITKTESNQNIFGDDNSGNSFILNTHTWNELSANDIHDTDANRKQLQFVTTQMDNLTSVPANEEWKCFETKQQYNVRDPSDGSINTTYFGNHGLHTTIGNSLGEIIRIDEFGHVCIGKDAYKQTKGSGNILLNQVYNAALEISGNIYVTNDVIVGNDQIFRGNQITEGTTDLCGAVHMYDTLEVDGDASFNSDVVVVGTTDLCGAVHMYNKLGIGTTSPTYSLDVTGTMRVGSTIADYAKFSDDGVEFGPTQSSVMIGYQAGYNAGTQLNPADSVIIGRHAGYYTSSTANVVVGNHALSASSGNIGSVAIGHFALEVASTGGANTGVGYYALRGVTTGRGNVAIGHMAGYQNELTTLAITTGNYNTFLGGWTHSSGTAHEYSTAIGYNAQITKSRQIVLGETTDAPDVYIPGNLGIGTTSPTTALTIRKQIDTGTPTRNNYGMQASMIEFKSYHQGHDEETVKSAIYSGVSEVETLNTQGGFMAFHVNNNGTMEERLRIEKNGNVGIGTTNPTARCKIFGNSGLTISPSDVSGVRTAVLRLGAQAAEDDDYYCAKITSTNNQTDNFKSDLRFHTYDGDADANPRPAIKERMCITSDGNVGIGTTTPAYTLDVSGTMNVNGAVYMQDGLDVFSGELGTTSGDEIVMAQFRNRVNENSNYIRITHRRYQTGGTDWHTASTKIQQTTDTTNQGFLEFNPPNHQYGICLGNHNGRHLTITSDGNVGIGTTAPAYTLDVSGTIKASTHLRCGGDIFMDGGNNTISCNTGLALNSETIMFRNSSGTENMRITSGGQCRDWNHDPYDCTYHSKSNRHWYIYCWGWVWITSKYD